MRRNPGTVQAAGEIGGGEGVRAIQGIHQHEAILEVAPQGSDFAQVMLFLPKIVASPIVFVSDWAFRSVFATRL